MGAGLWGSCSFSNVSANQGQSRRKLGKSTEKERKEERKKERKKGRKEERKKERKKERKQAQSPPYPSGLVLMEAWLGRRADGVSELGLLRKVR